VLAEAGDLAAGSQCNADSDCWAGGTCDGQQADGSGNPCDPAEESGCLLTCTPAPAPAGNACEAAGGACVPLVPDACEFGTVGDASTYSCGGGLGVQCCLPPAAQCRAIVECVQGKHWDATKCACVDNAAQCRAIVECVQGKHWDAGACACVDNTPSDGGPSDGGSSDAGCSADSDCSGILPQYCQVCSDGSQACAHWACVSGQCQIATCQ
jgi:hypothetical protein